MPVAIMHQHCNRMQRESSWLRLDTVHVLHIHAYLEADMNVADGHLQPVEQHRAQVGQE